MNLNYITQRKHLFKKRYETTIRHLTKLKIGKTGLVSLHAQRFELVYLRFLKKIIKRRHMRRKMFFRRRKVWFFLRPNCILTGKTVNSRMGAGVGSLVRLAIRLEKYKTFVEFRDYSTKILRYLYAYLRYKYPIKFKVQVDVATHKMYIW